MLWFHSGVRVIPKAVAARKKLADDLNKQLRRIVRETMERTGLTTLTDIARALNLRGIKTHRGCELTPTQIHRILKAA